VPYGPVSRLFKQTLEMRFGDTTWIDRRWMDTDKQ
jgi:hypothetical protein